MLKELTCIKTIICKDDPEICDFRQGELFDGEFTRENDLVVSDFSGELHRFENGEWQQYFKVNEQN